MNVSVLEGASRTVINGGTINAANEMHIYNYHGSQLGPHDMGNSVIAPLKPNSSVFFTGRKDILDQLKNHFMVHKAAGGPVTRWLFLLYGMGGIGKSQICLKFAENMATSPPIVFPISSGLMPL